MPGFSDFDDLDFKPYMDPSALIDTLSPNDMDMWNGYNFFSDENLNQTIKDDIKEENLDMDCCFSSICPNDLINSLDTNLKTNFQEENFDYSSSPSVSPDNHVESFDFVPYILQEQVDLSATSNLLSVGLENETGKYDLDSSGSSTASSTLPSPSQNPGQLLHIQPVQNASVKANLISMDKTKIKSSVLPPSPPSSFGSDSESNQSCQSVSNGLASASTALSKTKNSSKHAALKQNKGHSFQTKSSKCKSINANSKSSLNNSDDDCWPFFVSLSKLPSSGPILLTEEEKRTLIQEGHQVPTQLPLSKSEEKILKKIRRKIKNKISAQESRRKKKEYVDSLERKMQNYINENHELKKRLEDLELNNKNLLLELEKMKISLSMSDSSQSIQTNNQTINDINLQSQQQQQQANNTNQFSTLILVLVLFFTVVFGIWSPLITKDQLTNSVPAAATGLTRSQSTTTASSVAVVAVATAAAAATATAKGEQQADEPKQSIRQIIYDDNVPSLKRKLSDVDEAAVELVGAQANSSMARSKTGTTVELTKVRPFIGKISNIGKNSPPIISKTIQTNQTAPQGDYQLVVNQTNEDGQVIILNLANGQTSDIPKQMNNIRVVNSTPNTAKVPTRFRLISNSNPSNFNPLNQAVIKLSSS